MTVFRPRPKFAVKPPLRTGLYVMEVVGAGWLNKGDESFPRVEVEEWERLGSWSRVSIVAISGVGSSEARQVRDLVGDWIPTRSVIWRDASPASTDGDLVAAESTDGGVL